MGFAIIEMHFAKPTACNSLRQSPPASGGRSPERQVKGLILFRAGTKHRGNHYKYLLVVAATQTISIMPSCLNFLGEAGMGSRRRGSGRRKVGRKKRRMRAKIRHRK